MTLVARAGLLFDVAGLSTREVAVWLEYSESTVHHWIRRHRELLLRDGTYARIAAEAVHFSLHELE